MIHTLRRSPWATDIQAILRIAQSGDELLLLQNGVTAAIDDSPFLEKLCGTFTRIYALGEDIKARGLDDIISNYIVIINYSEFVKLVVKHSNQMAW